jgi:hypothetical protein
MEEVADELFEDDPEVEVPAQVVDEDKAAEAEATNDDEVSNDDASKVFFSTSKLQLFRHNFCGLF